ncbi:MAG: YidB family protein [Psychromonas sp.]
MATELLTNALGGSADSEQASSALSGLLGGSEGNLDLGGLAAKMAGSGDLSSVIGSWLGDGDNAGISADSITSLFGDSAIGDFAAKLGVDPSNAASALSDVLPQLMDQSSEGGSLLDSLGGAEGLLGAAKSFFS